MYRFNENYGARESQRCQIALIERSLSLRNSSEQIAQLRPCGHQSESEQLSCFIGLNDLVIDKHWGRNFHVLAEDSSGIRATTLQVARVARTTHDVDRGVESARWLRPAG